MTFRSEQRYGITEEGSLVGDAFLSELMADGFHVRLFGEQAGLEDVTGQGRVPTTPLLRTFADRQEAYGRELRLRRMPLSKPSKRRSAAR
jgi:hypothetical protein